MRPTPRALAAVAAVTAAAGVAVAANLALVDRAPDGDPIGRLGPGLAAPVATAVPGTTARTRVGPPPAATSRSDAGPRTGTRVETDDDDGQGRGRGRGGEDEDDD